MLRKWGYREIFLESVGDLERTTRRGLDGESCRLVP